MMMSTNDRVETERQQKAMKRKQNEAERIEKALIKQKEEDKHMMEKFLLPINDVDMSLEENLVQPLDDKTDARSPEVNQDTAEDISDPNPSSAILDTIASDDMVSQLTRSRDNMLEESIEPIGQNEVTVRRNYMSI